MDHLRSGIPWWENQLLSLFNKRDDRLSENID